VAAHGAWIAGEVLADELVAGAAVGGQPIVLDDEAITVRLTKV
jgi:hypothetical protein